MSIGDLICVLFTACAAFWFLLTHTTVAGITVLVAGLLCLVWLLARPANVQRGSRAALLGCAAAALLACMVWAVIELVRRT